MLRRTMVLGVLAVVGLSFLGVGAAAADTKEAGPLGLPSVDVLKDKLGLAEDHVKAVATVYAEWADKAKEAQKKGDEAAVTAMRQEIVGHVKHHLNDEQKKKFDELLSEKKEK